MRHLILIALLAPLAVACGGEETVQPTYTDISAKIFVPSCATSLCHSSKNTGSVEPPGGDLILDKDVGYANLQGKKVVGEDWPAAFKDFKLIEPGNPEKSALYLTLKQGTDLPKSLYMPDESKLSDARVEVIRQWIADGAKNN